MGRGRRSKMINCDMGERDKNIDFVNVRSTLCKIDIHVLTLCNFMNIVSLIDTYNYNLAKYLAGLLILVIPMNRCAKDSLSFVKGN